MYVYPQYPGRSLLALVIGKLILLIPGFLDLSVAVYPIVGGVLGPMQHTSL
ncbi:DUF3096 domain-containing protein [Candidatus Methylospira mobilis]|uniref:DUF3096 domain-containing protein n=1 Tax=Candidatus Methylospira mobilis TaxID=1808979 RepID=A0A5Q0BN87_9GAMM|nr:DUF3096 domain-containing protein [Candidatus Methylospira mobilis]QFY43216.1 DUF3096 domain-containing protein [Candidatus Methylospira mobilis]WNV03579.1 DUF3096 domain-containing protein [Candidatus Methylospira mobilis]